MAGVFSSLSRALSGIDGLQPTIGTPSMIAFRHCPSDMSASTHAARLCRQSLLKVARLLIAWDHCMAAAKQPINSFKQGGTAE